MNRIPFVGFNAAGLNFGGLARKHNDPPILFDFDTSNFDACRSHCFDSALNVGLTKHAGTA
jgi:hypothetical protein